MTEKPTFGRYAEIPFDKMIARYRGVAARLVIYLASHWREIDTGTLARWGEVARAVRKAG